ncbi:MAG TPA: DUF1800 domain-containing protein, partial [Micromonosporaceae bacterium]|nr:DUF1800 domain-containing protein [Micromonosporaceae bacterium]
MAERPLIAHLLRRATFGPTAGEVDAAERIGYRAALDRLLRPPGTDAAGTPPPVLGADPAQGLPAAATRDQRQQAQQARRDQIRTLTQWWVGRMVAADDQLAEKLVFFWHGHWATSVEKVKVAGLMLNQQNQFRRYGRADFANLARAMLRDPALIIWLDGQRNTKQAPNENLARELMELFTLGVGHYTEDDVKAGARALTGWTLDRATGAATVSPRRHDTGAKTILGITANHDSDSYVDILLRQPAHAGFLAERLWFRFASGEPMPAATRDRLADAYRAANRDVTVLVRELFLDEAFQKTSGQLVKQPIEWAVGAMRQLRIGLATMPDKDQQRLLAGLGALDQVPLKPPSVGGWPAGAAWLTTSSAQARLRMADELAAL